MVLCGFFKKKLKVFFMALLTWLWIGCGSFEEEDGSGLLNDDFAYDSSLLLYPERAGKPVSNWLCGGRGRLISSPFIGFSFEKKNLE